MSVVVQTDKTVVVHAPSGTVLVGQVLGGGGVPADWDALANKPLVIAAGNNQQEARDAIGLGTAATHNHEEYATAAQGSLADSAIQAGAGLGALDAAANTKLAGIAAGATANDTNAQLRDRATHTGTQTLSTISQSGATNGQVPTWNGTDWVAATPTPAPVQSVAGKVGAITLAKADVGLSNVDNTSDADKPVSTATASAIAAKIGEAPNDGKQYARKNEDWAEVVSGPAVMADITDKQGKVLDDLIVIEDYFAEIDGLMTDHGYIVKVDFPTNGLMSGATILVTSEGGVITQTTLAPLTAKVGTRYHTGSWSDWQYGLSTIDASDWHSSVTAEAANAVIYADGTFSRSLFVPAPLAPKITVGLTAEADTDILRPDPLTTATTFPNPTGTPMDGFGFVIELQDDGTARALTWGSDYAAGFAALPTTTTAGKLGQIAIQYRSGKYRCDGVRWMA